MRTVTQPLREEHKELLPHIEALRSAGDSVAEVPLESLRHSIDQVHEFLTHHLLPHAQAEEQALYPVVARILGAPEATATMRRDHVEVGRLIEELTSLRAQLSSGGLSASLARDLRRVLYGLYTLVKTHFVKEEEVYLPLLDVHLAESEAHRMFAAMEEAAAQAKAQIRAQ